MKKFQIILGTLFFQFFFSQEVKDYISYIPKDYKIKFTNNYVQDDFITLKRNLNIFLIKNIENGNFGFKNEYILLYQKISDKQYYICSNSEYYWLVEKYKNLKKHYFLGLQRSYCFLKPNKKDFIKDGIIQLDIVFLSGNLMVSPSEFDDFKIVKNGVKLSIKLADLKVDTDKDGYNDIFENYYGLNRLSKDSDGDGIDDLKDKNPLYKSSNGDYQYIYEDILNKDFSENEIYDYDTIKSYDENLCTINPKKKIIIVNLKTNTGLMAKIYLARYDKPFSEIKKIDNSVFHIWVYPNISEKIQYEYKKTNKGWEKNKLNAFII